MAGLTVLLFAKGRSVPKKKGGPSPLRKRVVVGGGPGGGGSCPPRKGKDIDSAKQLQFPCLL
eukprot:jgi/Botrbrau1/20859/Bobra.0561s0004.1